MVFVIEVLRILIGLLRFTKMGTSSSLESGIQTYESGNFKGSQHEEKERRYPTPPLGPLVVAISSASQKHFLVEFRHFFWVAFPYSPLLTSLPAPIIVGHSLGKSDFQKVHGKLKWLSSFKYCIPCLNDVFPLLSTANHFVCATTEIEAQRMLGILNVINLVPTSILGCKS